MAAEISVIIPTLDAEGALPDCLAALMEGVTAGLIRELIVSDGGSGDATCALAEAVGAEVAVGAPSRGGQLRRGAAQARGAWFLIVHADTELAPGWARVVSDHIRRPDAGAAWFRLRFRAKGIGPRWVAGWANLRAHLFRLPYGDQGLLIRRTCYEATGGYPDQPLMEDVALMRVLKGPLTGLPALAVTSARKYQDQGWLRRGARNLWTLARYFMGTDPSVLADRYRR